ncbi:tumor necrosis factor receptor superfamily member 8 isoform X2 [Homo sapiens]|uniref:tumor necrosis factor receptor superfamily member 8 isoform X2 n=1 Tax=Homo sapiens TaxID=9606 RepID=UPI001FB0A592|nr:tumor necrosis factor receptor superfamily member 8 isoform X2 [Homo sapiens]XP_054195656.1 tumor necrosis factor receptor superfamily member 8 isoform X2 [Homo sapiens]
MRVLLAALGLLFLGALRAFPQDRPFEDTCHGNPSHYYDKAVRRCCYRCPMGLFPTQQCPQRPTDCRKQCEPDYYLDEADRCTACVTCSRDDLVEKTPCAWNSSRVCECRPGMFCSTSAVNSCARCFFHSVCPAGMIVKFPGTAQKNTVCEPASPGVSPACASPENCKEPSSGTIPQAKPTPVSPATSSASTMPVRGGTRLAQEAASKLTRAPDSPSSVGRPSSDPGLSPTQPCPEGSGDCRKQCEPDYYLDEAGRCTACVSCSRDDLVEKTPCAWNSSRTCECRPGMICATSATNSCARCVPYPICAAETVTKPQDMAEKDTTFEAPPLGTQPDCNPTPENGEAPASTSPTQSLLVDSQASKTLPIPTSAPVALSSTGKPVLDAGPVLFWVILVLVVVVGSSAFLLCHRRACRKRIRQNSRPRRSSTQLRSGASVTEPVAEERGLMSQPLMETCHSVGAAYLESLPLQDASPAGGPSSPRDLPEPRVSTEHTNNKIEKIYIMKADTVIVGTVKAELPEGRGLAGPAEPELEEELEADHTPHYPEQETEPPLGSCSDVMLSVEEEGKEDPLPTAASGK